MSNRIESDPTDLADEIGVGRLVTEPSVMYVEAADAEEFLLRVDERNRSVVLDVRSDRTAGIVPPEGSRMALGKRL